MTKRACLIWTLFALTLGLPLFASWEEAVKSYQRGEFESAASQFRAVVAEHPDYAAAHFMLGRTLHRLGKLDQAMASLQVATELDPDDPQYALVLGQVRVDADQSTEAVSGLKAHRLDALPEKLQSAYAQVLATAACAAGTDDALQVLEQAALDLPSSKALWLALGKMKEATSSQGRGFQDLKRAFELDPTDTQLGSQLVARAFTLAHSKPEEEARREWYRQAVAVARPLVQHDDSLKTRLLLGEAWLGAGQYEKAEAWLRDISHDAPGEALPYYYLAQCSLAQGYDGKALGELRAALELTPDPDLERRIYNSMGYHHHKLRDYKQALEAYRKAGNDAKIAEMTKAVETDAGNRAYDEKRRQCLTRKAEFDKFFEDNRFLVGTADWKHMERKMQSALADCQPYL